MTKEMMVSDFLLLEGYVLVYLMYDANSTEVETAGNYHPGDIAASFRWCCASRRC
jgi:hypothetical protein